MIYGTVLNHHYGLNKISVSVAAHYSQRYKSSGILWHTWQRGVIMSAYGEILNNEQIKSIKKSMLDKNTKQLSGMSFERRYVECKSFYSYQTCIAEYMYGTGVLQIALDWFDCSASTRCQFSKWLNANGYVPYITIKRYAKRVRRELEQMYISEPTGEVFHDDETGTDFTFVF